ncbi:chorismate--pyruvate lyase family protein [Pseudomonas canadensis]|uniref:chorismate--pyruvate lyase family protein n=1 Tax=Pseudomonas canadensis TaxID=915099 RepID=UPI0027370A74|nr:chorismate lyase [Pseudomonas canadensis]WLH30022.1 chorismate lyase [Pseudomonas canadensis]
MPHSIDPPDACQWLTQSLLSPLPTPLILNWLFDEGSMTQRLTRLSNNGFSITPLFEGWQPLRDDECAALDLPPASVGWVRETYLHGNGQPWLFARCVAARSTLQGDGLHMDALGSRPLGELLFSEHAFSRQAIEVCRYPRQWLPKDNQIEGLWARRSRFDRGALSVLVAEIFLPSVWQAVHAHPENC